MKRLFAVSAMTIALSGCGLFSDDNEDSVEPPAPLVELQAPLSINELWSASPGVGGDEQRLNLPVAIDGERLLVADREGRVYALNRNTGNEIWSVETDIALAAGPGVGEGLIMVGSSDGEVVALEADSGAERWRAKVTSEVLSVPVAAKGVAVIRTVDGKVAGYNADSGERLWLNDRKVPVLTLRGTGTPLILNDMAVDGFASGKLVALQIQDGREIWSSSIAIPRGRSELARLVDVDGNPVAADGSIYVTSYQGKVAAVDVATGDVRWRKDISAYTGVVLDGRQLYLTDAEGYVWCLDVATGAALWKQVDLRLRAVSTPAVQGEYIVVGGVEGYLHWLRKEDGALVAREQLGSKQPVLSAPVTVDGIVYAYSNDGRIAAYQAP